MVIENGTDPGSSSDASLEGASDIIDVWNNVDETVQRELSKETDPDDSDDYEDGDELDEDAEDSSDPDDDEDDSEEDDDDEELDDEEEDEEDDEDEEEEQEKPKKKKGEEAPTYKAKTADGKTIDVPGDATFRFRANGKMRSVSLDDLKVDYAGRVAYDEKLQRLSQRQKELDKKEVDSDLYVETLKESLEYTKAGDVGPALEVVGEMLGLEPGEYYDTMIEAFNQFFSKLIKEDPEERKITVRENRLKGIEARSKRQSKQDEIRRTSQQFSQQLESFAEKHKVSAEEIEYCHGVLEKRAKEAAKESGSEKKKVTVESIQNLVFNRKIYSGVLDALDKVGVDLGEEDTLFIFETIKRIDPEANKLKKSDYLDIVKEAVSDDSPKKALRRKAKKRNATPRKKNKKGDDKASKAKSLQDMWNV